MAANFLPHFREYVQDNKRYFVMFLHLIFSYTILYMATQIFTKTSLTSDDSRAPSSVILNTFYKIFTVVAFIIYTHPKFTLPPVI